MDSGSDLAPAGPPSTERLPVGTQVPEHLVMKLTRGHSCVLCQQRKVRCDKQKPCANCVKAQVECKVVPPQPPRRRRKKPQERDLIERLKKYENLLAQHGVNFDPIADDLKASDNADDIADLGQDLGGLKTSPESNAPDYSQQEVDEKSIKYFPYYKEYRHTNDLVDSSDDEYEGPTIHHAFDAMFENNDAFPFTVGGAPASVTNSHPSPIQILQLWQIYISNVNPLLKISHVPTLQSQIIAAGANLAKIPKPLEALMFGIYFMAITSMHEEEVQSTFGEDRSVLLAKYHTATQQALVNAGFMRTGEYMVLQAYLLYLLSVREYTDPRSLFCLIGVGVRVATRLGLHRDGAQFGMAPFETEQRRRLWWQLVILDKRIAEITGSSITAFSSSGSDCRLPLNINDTDLNTHSKDPPTPYVGPTEMLFVLTRIELTVAAAPNSPRPNLGAPLGGQKPRIHYSPSPSSPDVITNAANHNLPQEVDAYCNYIESVYLKQCDPKIPLHLFTLMMTRQALCKLRVIDFLCRRVEINSLDQSERDALFSEAIRLVEYDNMMFSNDSLRGYQWYLRIHFPLPAYMFLFSELRARKTGELCDRAWDVILENQERRGMVRSLRNPMHIALGNLFVKAWDTREAAEARMGNQLQPPKIISMLRQHMAKMEPKRGAAGTGPAPGGEGSTGGTNGGSTGYGQRPPTGSSRTSSSASPSVGLGASAAAYGGGKPMPEGPMAAGAGSMGFGGGGMSLDGSMMFSGFDSVGQVFGGGGIPDTDFSQMDWSHYMPQYGGGFGGFGGAPAPGWPAPGMHPSAGAGG